MLLPTYIFLFLLKAHNIDHNKVLGASQQFSKGSDKAVAMGASTSIVQSSSEYCYVTQTDCASTRPLPVAADYNIYNVLYDQ